MTKNRTNNAMTKNRTKNAMTKNRTKNAMTKNRTKSDEALAASHTAQNAKNPKS